MAKAIVSEGKNVLKNILIGIATSVLGATAIYFIGFNNKETYSRAELEELAVEAWKTYVTVENIYVRNRVSLLSDLTMLVDFNQAAVESKEESEKLQTSLTDLADKNGLGSEMADAFKKRVENEKKEWPKTETLFKDLAVINAKRDKENWTKQQTLDAVSLRVSLFVEEFKTILTAEAGNIEELANKLAKKYNKTFDPDNFLIVQARKYKKDIFNLTPTNAPVKQTDPGQPVNPGTDAGSIAGEVATVTSQYLVGKWDAGSTMVTLNANGSSKWLVPADKAEAKGTWQLKDQRLIIRIKKHPVSGKEVIWTFNISNPMTNSCTITNTSSPYTSYNLSRNKQ